jgi:hypothetical protein
LSLFCAKKSEIKSKDRTTGSRDSKLLFDSVAAKLDFAHKEQGLAKIVLFSGKLG